MGTTGSRSVHVESAWRRVRIEGVVLPDPSSDLCNRHGHMVTPGERVEVGGAIRAVGRVRCAEESVVIPCFRRLGP